MTGRVEQQDGTQTRDKEVLGEGCYFCHDFSSLGKDEFFHLRHPEMAGRTRILAETMNFWLFPDMSPVSVNHVLIVTKGHITSFACLPVQQAVEVTELCQIYKDRIPALDYFMFEHGTGQLQDEQKPCGSSVSHAHLHIIPITDCRDCDSLERVTVEARKVLETDGWLIEIRNDGDVIKVLKEISRERPYLFIKQGDRSRIFIEQEGITVPSQFLRRVCANVFSGTDSVWDRKVQSSLTEEIFKMRVRKTFQRWGEGRDSLTGDIYDFSHAGFDDVNAIRAAFCGLNKLDSILILKSLGFPVSNGVVVSRFDESVYRELNRRYKGQVFGLRTDKREETTNLPRGGYDVRVEELNQVLPQIVRDGRVAILLKVPEGTRPTRYDHIYSMNLYFLSNRICIEIVGQGFDTSDLNRGEITPHQVLEIPLSEENLEGLTNWELKRFQTQVCSSSDYRASVGQRLAKIGRGLTEGARSETDETDAIERGRRFLLQNGKRLLLKGNETYKPIPLETLNKILSYALVLPDSLPFFGITAKDFVLGCSVYSSGEIKFWDIVFPRRKFSLGKY